MRAAPAALAAALAIAGLLTSGTAGATPTRWDLARSERAYRDDAALRAAEQELLAHARVKKGDALVPAEDSMIHASRAREILVEADAASSPRGVVRMMLGQACFALHRFDEAVAAFESVVSDPSVSVPLRASTHDDLAIALARLGRIDEEIASYDAAISLDPIVEARSLYLSNQAEAHMVRGDTRRAIAGYRAALDGLAQGAARELRADDALEPRRGARSVRDLDGALDAIALARGIDPDDSKIHGPGWFFVPEYDAAYFAALGHWLVARRGTDEDVRMSAYEHAILSWKEYLLRAPESDKYRAVATARLKAVQAEYDIFAERARTPTPLDHPAAARSAPPTLNA